MEDLADRLLAWLQPFAPMVYIGHSMGGYLGLALAAKAPQLFAGLCLLHSTTLPDTPAKKETRTKTMEFLLKNGKEAFLHGFVPNLFHQKQEEAMRIVREIGLETPLDSMVEMTRIMRDRPDYSALPAILPFPVKWIAGAQDALIPVESLLMQVCSAADGHLHVLQNTGHMGMYESTRQTAYSILSFSEYCFHCSQPCN